MPVNSTGTYGVIETNPFGRFLPLSGGTMTGSILGASGTEANPSYSFSSDAASGMWLRSANALSFSSGGAARLEIQTGAIKARSTGIYGWTAGMPSASLDSGFSRVSAGVIGVGTGGSGSTAGTLRAAALAANGSDFTITAANTVSPTSPNRTITISYGGTTYYLAAKTTND